MPTVRPRLPTLARVAVLVPTLAAGCGGDGAGERADFRVETFDGIPHSVAADAPERVEAALELLWEAPTTAELLDGSDWANPSQIAADAGGVAVSDPQLGRVHLFSPEGERIRSVGRRGSGPGELNGPGTLALHGDTLVVQDTGRLALQLFRRSDGEYAGSVGAGEGMSFGFQYLWGTGIVRSAAVPSAGGMEQEWIFLPLGGSEGEEGERQAFQVPGTHPLQPEAAEGGSGCWRRAGLGPHLLEVDCTFPLVRVVSRDGEVLREHRIERQPRLTDPEVLERLRRSIEETMRGTAPANVPAETFDQMVGQMVAQTVEQNRWARMVRGVAGSPGGDRIVIWEQLPSGFDPATAALHVLDGEGRYLLRAEFQETFQSLAVSDDRVYVLVPEPETDLRRLRAYRMP
jgi:hypothetical protein